MEYCGGEAAELVRDKGRRELTASGNRAFWQPFRWQRTSVPQIQCGAILERGTAALHPDLYRNAPRC